jgi:hypothetical protein
VVTGDTIGDTIGFARAVQKPAASRLQLSTGASTIAPGRLADTLGAYKNWGVYQPGGKQEPFIPNGGPPELCGAANFTAMSQGVGGWANSQCGNKFIWMCKIRCGWHLQLRARPSTAGWAEPPGWAGLAG